MGENVPGREPNGRGSRGQSTFENEKEKQNNCERTLDTGAKNVSKSQSFTGNLKEQKDSRETTTQFWKESVSTEIFLKSEKTSILLWLNPLIGLKG